MTDTNSESTAPRAETSATAAPPPRPAVETAGAAPRRVAGVRARVRRWTGGWLGRVVRWGAAALAVLLAVLVVASSTVDLGPLVRRQAEEAASNYVDREVTIGRIGAYLLPGRFLVEDVVIAGLNPGDRPFLVADEVILSVTWKALFQREFLVDSVLMTDWRMLVESFPDGRQSFPNFVPRADTDDAAAPAAPASEDDDRARRIVTTVQYLHASDGAFRYDDHGSNWSVDAPNLDFTITKGLDYLGHAAFSGGTIKIGDFEPMWVEMTTNFRLDGPEVHLTTINLETDGASTVLEGRAALSNFPSMAYALESDIDLERMREIFFTDDDFTTSGTAHFSGTFELFSGGHDLGGGFTSPVLGLSAADIPWRFPDLAGQLRWQRDRFEVWDVVSAPYGGHADVDFSMAPLGAKEPGWATFDVRYEDVELERLIALLDVRGISPVARASGRNLLRWPLGEFSRYRDEGRVELHSSEGITLAGPDLAPGAAAAVEARAGRPADLTTRDFAVGGAVDYVVTDNRVELTSGHVATPSTYAAFDGQTGAGVDTRIPFRVVSTDWQESDRLMAAVMTAMGSPTRAFELDGAGTFDGVMLGRLSAPRIEATFNGEALRAWNVNWGTGRGEIVVDNGYIDIANGMFERDGATFGVDGLFSTSLTRTDGGEEMNAVFNMSAFPSSNMRAAFELDYSIDGLATGEMHLYGAYRRLFGFGSLALDQPLAYGLSFDSAAAGLRFEGNGVRLDGFEMRRGEGVFTGAAFIDWDATYSFNWDARNIDVGTIELIPDLPEPLSGAAEFNVSGVGAFDNPRYVVDGTVVDLFVGDQEIGQVTGRLDVRDEVLTLDLEGASSTFAVSADGRVALNAQNDGDVRVVVTNMSLAPYVRMFVPGLSPYASALVSGSARVSGQLRDWDRLTMEATVQQANLSLLDYDVWNDGPMELTIDQRVIGIDRMLLAGDGTALDVSGTVDLANDTLGVTLAGDANLDILDLFVDDLRGSGTAAVQARVEGPIAEPVLIGQATLFNGRIRHLALPHGVDALNGRIAFEPGAIRFDDVGASMAGGQVTIGGRVGLNSFRPDELGVTVSGQEMQWRYLEGSRSLIDAEVVLRGTARAPVLSGRIDVRDAVLPDGSEMGTELFGSAEETVDAALVETESAGVPLALDVRIVAPSSLRMTSNAMRVVASADLTLQGTLDQPLLFGSAEIDSGETFFEGNRYRLNYGTIGFANPTRIEPYINIEVETDVRVPGQTYRVTVRATGTLDPSDPLVLTFSSDPPLPEVDVLGMLMGDVRDPRSADLRAARAPELAQQQRMQAALARLFTRQLSSPVGRVVEESFGVDTFQITPSLGDPSFQQSAQFEPTARLLIGQQLSGRAHLTLSRAVTGANRGLLVVLEYDQSDRMSWILSQNEDRTYALDFRVRHAF